MKKQLLVLLVFIPIFCSAARDNKNNPYVDSLFKKIYEYNFSDPEKGEEIIALIKEQDLVEKGVIQIIEGDFYMNINKVRIAILHYKQALQSEYLLADDEKYLAILSRLINCYNLASETGKAIEAINEMSEKAKKLTDKGLEGSALFELGAIIHSQNEKNKAYEYMTLGIQLMDKSKIDHRTDDLFYMFTTLANCQINDSLYLESLQTLDLFENEIETSHQNKEYADNFYSEMKSRIYAFKAIIYQRMNRSLDAEKNYQLFKQQANTENSIELNYLIFDYLLESERFEELVEMCKATIVFFTNHYDAYSSDVLQAKLTLAKAYAKMNEPVKSLSLYEDCIEIQDSIKSRDQRSDALEFAAIYETNEKEATIKEQQAKMRIHRLVLVVVAVLTLLVATILFLVWRHMKQIQLKNRALAKQIKEIQLYKQSEHAMDDQSGDRKKEFRSADGSLYQRINELMVKEKLYRNSQLTREELASLLGTNRNRLCNAIQEYTGMNFNDYINSWRFDEAIRLIESNQNDKFEKIAEDAGFSRSSFYRLFKQKFGITPAEYKKAIEEENNNP